MDYKTAAWRMDMARGVKATDPVRGTVLMHRFREGRRERVAESGILAGGECGERGWQAIGRHGAHSGKPGVEVRGGRGGEERRPSVASSNNNNINNYNDQKRHPQLQL